MISEPDPLQLFAAPPGATGPPRPAATPDRAARGGGRIVVLSDTHLSVPGRGAHSAAALRPLWRGADEVIFNGDVAEVADERLRGPAARQVVELLRLAEEDGVAVTLISGNHDPLVTDRRYLRLAGREVFLTHGDILHPAISPWTDHGKHLARLHADAVMSLDPGKARDIDAQLAACQHASVVQWDHFVTRPHRRGAWARRVPDGVLRKTALARKLVKAAYYWQTIPRRAMGFARRFAPESRFFVFGHIHRAGVWVDPGAGPGGADRVIINTGAYQSPRNPRAVVIENRRLEVWPVVFDRGGHAFGPRPLTAYPMEQVALPRRVEDPGVERSA